MNAFIIFSTFFSNKSVISFKFSHPKRISLAENASFDVLIDKIRPAVFAVSDDKKRGREGKEREGTQSHNTLYFSYLWGGPPGLIPIKFGIRVAPCNVFNMSNFCIKIFRVSDQQLGQNPRFSSDCWSSLQQCCATVQPVM